MNEGGFSMNLYRSSTKRHLIRCIGIAVLLVTIIAMSGCSSSSSYRSSSSYSKRDAYDAKYGAGSYDSDKAFIDSMRDAYNSMGH